MGHAWFVTVCQRSTDWTLFEVLVPRHFYHTYILHWNVASRGDADKQQWTALAQLQCLWQVVPGIRIMCVSTLPTKYCLLPASLLLSYSWSVLVQENVHGVCLETCCQPPQVLNSSLFPVTDFPSAESALQYHSWNITYKDPHTPVLWDETSLTAELQLPGTILVTIATPR